MDTVTQASRVVSRVPPWRSAVVVGALLLVTGACAGPNPATHFCTDYGDAMHDLIVAARAYGTAPTEFATAYANTMDDLDRMRAGAPDERLRDAFDTARFTFSVFDNDAALADFLTRADFTDNAVVLACADYGIELRPAAG